MNDVKVIQILENYDILTIGDWCRPLHITPMNGGNSDHYAFEENGRPCNNIKWVLADRVFGECHFGKTIKQLRNQFIKFCDYEFVRGDIPMQHTQPLTLSEYKAVDINRDSYLRQHFNIGKFKGRSVRTVMVRIWIMWNGLNTMV